MEKQIKYIGFYTLPGAKPERVSSLAATSKMDYICEAINQAGYSVHLISPSWISGADSSRWFHKQNTVQVSEGKKITFCPSFVTKTKITRNIKILFTLAWLFFWLLKNAKKNEKILVYHVQWLSIPIRWAKVIKGFKLILEVEEIYGKVWENKQVLNLWEQKLIQSADCYFAASDILAEILGEKTKVIIYGSYAAPGQKDIPSFPPHTHKVNVIYAGSIDNTKGGAFNAVKCSRYLSSNHLIHICGHGSDEDLQTLRELINSINSELGREACIYHGVKIGDDFTQFMFSCQIGINPQKQGDYMETAFPSKVISYLAHNLMVVSTPIKSIIRSKIADYVIFQKGDSPQEIAQAIMSVDLDKLEQNKAVIESLNQEFVKEIKRLFKN